MTICDQIKGRLIVSCQAWPGDPLDHVDTIRRIARAAVMAGAAGLRIHSPEHIAAIRQDTSVPIIGISKQYQGDRLRITPDFKSAQVLAAAGASIIALDCTSQSYDFGEPWREILRNIRERLGLPVMADIATLSEALAAAEAGADFIGTTLHGYTEETRSSRSFNWDLLSELVRKVKLPILAEGHIATPEDARRAVAEGAHCVVVGGAITRPGDITRQFVRAIEPRRDGAPALGVDLGGTSIKAGIVSRTGGVSSVVRVPTEAPKGRDIIAANLARAIEQVLAFAKEEGISPCGLGIASAGVINASDGSIFAATDNLPGWTGFPLRQFAEERFGLPVWVLNDAHAVVVAEQQFGLGARFANFAVITLGTGVGGGIVSAGRLIQGNQGFAGSIGHHVIRIDGLPCNCGRSGCLEAYVSTAALLREYARHPQASSPPSGLTESELAWKINRLALAGNPAAQQAYGALSHYLAEGIANLFAFFDPQAVLLCGGLIEGLPTFAADVKQMMREILPFGDRRSAEILLATGGSHAGMVGAGALAFIDVPS
jgi:glucokinase-like ROK family protein